MVNDWSNNIDAYILGLPQSGTNLSLIGNVTFTLVSQVTINTSKFQSGDKGMV